MEILFLEAMSQEPDGSSGARIRAAHTDYQKTVRITLKLRCRFFDTLILFPAIIRRKAGSARKAVIKAGLIYRLHLRRSDKFTHCRSFMPKAPEYSNVAFAFLFFPKGQTFIVIQPYAIYSRITSRRMVSSSSVSRPENFDPVAAVWRIPFIT